MKRFGLTFTIATLATVLLGAIVVNVMTHEPRKANAQAVTTTQLPVATVTAVATSAVTIAPANAGRRTFSVCNNAGSANPLFVLPGTSPVVTTANGIQIAAGTCLNQPTNAVQSGTALGGGNSWQGITAGTATAAFIEW